MKSEYPDNRLEGETVLRQAQLVMLKLLKAFHAICERNSLRYWLDAGTLLGAVRHKGFIPWDDDLDVMMPNEDYLKFIEIAQRDLPFDMFFQTPETDPGYSAPWVRMRDRYSHIDNDVSFLFSYSHAIYIDIFPAITTTSRQHKLREYCSLLPPACKKIQPIKPSRIFKKDLKRTVLYFFKWIFLFFMIVPSFRRCFLKWTGKGKILWKYKPPIAWENLFPDEIVFPLKKIKFEDFEFWGPADAHNYLASRYGDYMILPSEEKRKGNHFITAIYPTGPNKHFSGLEWK